MSAVRRRNAQELLCGALPASMLSYAAVLHIHAVTGLSSINRNTQNDGQRVSIQIARCNDELPLLSTQHQPTTSPIFDEVLVVHTNALEKLELLLCSLEDCIDEYQLDLDHHHPHQSHHLALQGASTTLYMTLIIKLAQIPQTVAPGYDLQILVQYLETPLPQVKGPVVIAASMPCDEPFHKIDFFSRTTKQIHMSMAQGPSDQPQWHHTFLLPDCQLNQSVAIVLFHMSQINQDEKWNLGDTIGHTMLPFTQPLLTSLKDKKEGICFTGVPVTTPHHYSLTLRVVIRLGVSPLLPGGVTEEIPVLKWGEREENEKKDEAEVKRAQVFTPPEDNMGLPSHTAIMQLLEKHLPRSRTVSHSSTQLEPEMLEEEHSHLTSVVKQQSDELKQYRNAVQKMGNDIMLCRDQIIQLKSDRAALTERIRDIECVVPSADLSRLPADKLVYECVAAQNKYTAQVQRSAQLEHQVKSLQSSLSRLKKDSKEVEELRHAHTAQNQLLQKLQEKIKVTQILEKTCRDQEKVIEKLEAILQEEVPSRPATKHISFAPHPQILESTRQPDSSRHHPDSSRHHPDSSRHQPDSFYHPSSLYRNDIPAIPKLEPLDSILPPPKDKHSPREKPKKVSPEGSVISEDVALRLRVGALENQLHLAQQTHQHEAHIWAEDRMDLQLQLALIQRDER